MPVRPIRKLKKSLFICSPAFQSKYNVCMYNSYATETICKLTICCLRQQLKIARNILSCHVVLTEIFPCPFLLRNTKKYIFFSVFGSQEQQYIDVIKQMLLASLTDQSYDVRFTAVRAAGNYLLLHDKACLCWIVNKIGIYSRYLLFYLSEIHPYIVFFDNIVL